jgi:hypothetical protein
MRTIEVVIFNPVIGCSLDVGKCVEEIGIQNLLPVERWLGLFEQSVGSG